MQRFEPGAGHRRWSGAYSLGAKEYGAGAFDWVMINGLKHIEFRHPCKYFTNDHTASHFPVEGPEAWTWDGDEERPTLSPSLISRVSDAAGHWHEDFHGYVRAGVLEVL